jgi:cell division protein FtsZ
MGDDVKITVIATGFKQQDMPERRERMLSAATLPTVRYEVPIQPRVTNARPATPRFASEAFAEPAPEVWAAPSVPVKEEPPVVGVSAPVAKAVQPELVPVPASVFDDDFFRSSGLDEVRKEPALPERYREPAHVQGAARVQLEETWSVTGEVPVADPVIRTAAFGGTVAAPAMDQSEPDELDIPAFLRRSN